MENEQYELMIGDDHETVRLTDRATGEWREWKGPRALYDALGQLAERRERDQASGEDSYEAWGTDAHGEGLAVVDGCFWPNEPCRGHKVKS